MNEANKASLEASKRLVEAGIVLETEFYWAKYPRMDYELADSDHALFTHFPIPAPSMAEVWRELEKLSDKEIATAILMLDGWDSIGADIALLCINFCRDINKLIDLLIWVRKENCHV